MPKDRRGGADAMANMEVFGTDEGGSSGEALEEQPPSEELEAEEETKPQQMLCTPFMPSHEEVELHRASSHMPYRPWCNQCVEGQGKERGLAQTFATAELGQTTEQRGCVCQGNTTYCHEKKRKGRVSGGEWSGVEGSGVEWSEVEWSGVKWSEVE